MDPSITLEPAERELGLTLDGYGTVVDEVATTLEPHRLAGYLYELARAFTGFYDTCPVLTAPRASGPTPEAGEGWFLDGWESVVEATQPSVDGAHAALSEMCCPVAACLGIRERDATRMFVAANFAAVILTAVINAARWENPNV